MKGLLAKDFALFMQRKRFFLAAFAAAVVIAALGDNDAFVATWLCLLVSIFSISTISYDEYDNSMPFLMSMPVTGKLYAEEKYLVLIVFDIAAGLASAVLILASAFARKDFAGLGEDMAGIIMTLGLIAALVSLVMPAMLKWGSEKGRLIILFVAGVVGAIFFAAANMNTNPGAFTFFTNLGFYKTAALSVGVAAAVTAVSLVISIRIMEKKEF